MVVAIDAGHGGSDTGAKGPTGLKEADTNLVVAKLVKRGLEELGQRVVMTRANNTMVSLGTRCKYANDAGAQCFVSIHCNAYSDHEVGGLEVFHYPGSPNGLSLAKIVYAGIRSTMLGMRERGVKEDRFYVLRHTRMPACLVELAFISNPVEERLLADATAQRRMADGIVWGVVQFLRRAKGEGSRVRGVEGSAGEPAGYASREG